MIRFTLFGVQVSIHPTLWLTLAILGRAYCVSSVVELMSALLFIVSAFVILLAHEIPAAEAPELLHEYCLRAYCYEVLTPGFVCFCAEGNAVTE